MPNCVRSASPNYCPWSPPNPRVFRRWMGCSFIAEGGLTYQSWLRQHSGRWPNIITGPAAGYRHLIHRRLKTPSGNHLQMGWPFRMDFAFSQVAKQLAHYRDAEENCAATQPLSAFDHSEVLGVHDSLIVLFFVYPAFST